MAEREMKSFVFYPTFLQAVESLRNNGNEILADKLLKAIVDYGIYGEYDDSDPIINAIMVQTVFSIDKSYNNYQNCIINGSKGGAKKKYSDDQIYELIDKGMTHKQIAEQLGCSTKTIQRALGKRPQETEIKKFTF